MLSSVEVISKQASENLSIPIEQEESDGDIEYFVYNIEGIDPVKATMSMTEYAHEDGAYFQRSKMETRNIVLTLGMNPDYGEVTVPYLRERLYQYFMPGVEVQLIFHDTVYVERAITGVVEALEFPIFTSAPVASISIICPDPHFEATEDIVEVYDTTPQSQWEPLIYNGTIPTGVVFDLTATATVSDLRFQIQNESTQLETLTYTPSLAKGQRLRIDTRRGYLSATRYQGSTETNVLHGVALGSKWPRIYPGNNLIRVYSVSNPQEYSMSYKVLFGGL